MRSWRCSAAGRKMSKRGSAAVAVRARRVQRKSRDPVSRRPTCSAAPPNPAAHHGRCAAPPWSVSLRSSRDSISNRRGPAIADQSAPVQSRALSRELNCAAHRGSPTTQPSESSSASLAPQLLRDRASSSVPWSGRPQRRPGSHRRRARPEAFAASFHHALRRRGRSQSRLQRWPSTGQRKPRNPPPTSVRTHRRSHGTQRSTNRVRRRGSEAAMVNFATMNRPAPPLIHSSPAKGNIMTTMGVTATTAITITARAARGWESPSALDFPRALHAGCGTTATTPAGAAFR